MSDYLVEETLDFAEKILFGMGPSTEKSREAALVALHRGIMFLSPAALNAALRVLKSKSSGQDLTDAGREFLLTIRREIDAVAIEEDDINQLWQSIVDLPRTEWQRADK